MKNSAMMLVFLLVLLGAIGRSGAATYSFATIDAPDAGLNDASFNSACDCLLRGGLWMR